MLSRLHPVPHFRFARRKAFLRELRNPISDLASGRWRGASHGACPDLSFRGSVIISGLRGVCFLQVIVCGRRCRGYFSWFYVFDGIFLAFFSVLSFFVRGSHGVRSTSGADLLYMVFFMSSLACNKKGIFLFVRIGFTFQSSPSS